MPEHLVERVEVEKRFDDMGSALLEQLAFARFVEGGDFARYLRRVRPIYRSRRDATIDALEDLLPELRWQGAAAGLHLHVLLPAGATSARWRWTPTTRAWWSRTAPGTGPTGAPPRRRSCSATGRSPEPAIRRAIETLARALQDA